MENNYKKRLLKLAVSGLLLAGILAGLFYPLPYYVETPGSTIDLSEIITVDDKEDKDAGTYSLTSVSVGPATGLRLLFAKFSDFSEVISKEALMGGSSSDEYNQMQNYLMKNSQNNAIAQAFELADIDYTMEFKGIYVMSIQDNSEFKGDLSLGDTIVKADGKSFENNKGFVNYIKSKKVGDELTITFLHNGKEKNSTHKLVELDGEKGTAGIGITLIDDTEIESDIKVDFNTGSIGGPSAGMMFTLEIYDQLVKEDLTNGLHIAGTGTINSEGKVGRIGGIDKKVASASKSHADVFFAPDDEITDEEKKSDPDVKSNYEEALEAAEKLGTDMKIVPVKTVQDAIDYLEGIDK